MRNEWTNTYGYRLLQARRPRYDELIQRRDTDQEPIQLWRIQIQNPSSDERRLLGPAGPVDAHTVRQLIATEKLCEAVLDLRIGERLRAWIG